MKGSGRIATGLIVFIGLIVWCLAPVFAQTMTFNFHPDGTMTNEHESHEGYSIERFDSQMRPLEVAHYFPGGVRMRMFNKYRYENNMMVEEISYLYTQGYERETMKFNARGYEIESRSYISKTEGNWEEISYMIQGYDERNNRNYFRVKYTGYGTLTNSMSRTTYDYSKRTRSVVEYEFDANDREISSRSYKSGLAQWQMDRAGEYVFDINTHGENFRPNRVVQWNGNDQNGNRLERYFMNSTVLNQTFDRNDRVIRIALGRPDYDDNNNLQYREDEIIEFQYDQQGRLVKTESRHYSENKEKTIFNHGRQVEAKHYRMNNSGNWKLIDTKNHANIDLFTPGKSANGNRPVARSIKQENPANSEIHEAPVAQSTHANSSNSTKPARPLTSQSLVNDINGLNIESNQSESLSAFSMDAERLTHIAEVLSHTTGTKFTEEQVLALAMQLLIENYNADLREMNTAYLKDKVSVFD